MLSLSYREQPEQVERTAKAPFLTRHNIDIIGYIYTNIDLVHHSRWSFLSLVHTGVELYKMSTATFCRL